MRRSISKGALTGIAALVVVSVLATGAVARPLDQGAIADRPARRGAMVQATARPLPTTTPYGLPVADARRAAWGTTHAGYPATDVFAGCGATLVSPVWGTVLEVRRVDAYDPAVDNPATRGGRSIAILGYDGVRYYLAHLDEVDAELAVGNEVRLGQRLGTMGATGRTGGVCHLHFGISPPCPGVEWSVRRGVVWPYPYLDAWRGGEQRSPAPEVERWLGDQPAACADAIADPYAPDAA